MSGTYSEYTRVYDVREKYLKGEQNTDDVLLLDFIREASDEIDSIFGGHFFPTIEARAYDTPKGRCLTFDDVFNPYLLELTTLTNGDGATIAASQFQLKPYNSTPRTGLELLPTATSAFTVSTTTGSTAAISVLGVWGYHDRYSNGAWESTQATLSAGISSGAASLTCTTGKIKAGDLLKIDSEFFYASAVTVGATDTVTVESAVNGSTAAAHLSGATLYRWKPPAKIAGIARRAAAGKYRLVANPIGETVSVDGQTFHTPGDVVQFIQKQLKSLYMERSPL